MPHAINSRRAALATSNSPEGSPRVARFALLVSLWGVFVSNVTLTILIIALPVIAADMPGHLGLTNWVGLAPLLAVASITPLAGRATDRYGAKRLWLLGFALTLTGIGCSALAPSLPWLVAARFATGAGTALFVPAALAISSALYPPAERATPIGYWTSAVAISPLLGVLVGGYLTELLGWRMLFVAQLGLGLPALLLGLALPASPRAAAEPFDWEGALAGALAASSLLACATLLGTEALFSPRIGLAALVTIASVYWLCRAELRAERPVFPPALLGSRVVRRALYTRAALSFTYMGAFMTLPFLLSTLWGLSQSSVALLLSSRPLAMGLTGPLAGRLTQRFGAASLAIAGAWLILLATAAFVLLGRVPNYACLTLGLVVAGVGLGIGSPGTVAAVTARVEPAQLGTVAGLMTLTSTLANALGMAGLFAVVEAHGGVHDENAYRLSNLVGAGVAALGLWAAYGLRRSELSDPRSSIG
ncbi:MAG: Major Facilitator Superfamily transporter [Myxococcaceae bacterium]|nr:Major Facilitator Superfamily transporter [Myxococcaceae bacterium]